MKMRLNMERSHGGLGAERRGKVAVSGDYFGAQRLLADIEARFRAPSGGGRPTDASWTERRLVPLAPRTLKRLEEIAAKVRAKPVTPADTMGSENLGSHTALEWLWRCTRAVAQLGEQHPSSTVAPLVGEKDAVALSDATRGRKLRRSNLQK